MAEQLERTLPMDRLQMVDTILKTQKRWRGKLKERNLLRLPALELGRLYVGIQRRRHKKKTHAKRRAKS